MAQQLMKSKQCSMFQQNQLEGLLHHYYLVPAINNTYIKGFDLLYISIDSFNTLCQNYKGAFNNWGVKVVYVDQFHLALTDCYQSMKTCGRAFII